MGGDGKLGLLITEVLARQNLDSKLILLGRHAERAELLGSLPVEFRELERGKQEPPEDLKEAFDVVVDATGSAEGTEFATKLVMPMGTVVLKTTCAKPSTLNTSMYVVKEISIIGSRCGPFPPAIELLSSGDLDASKYISAEFPLSEAEQALSKASEKGCLKVHLVVSEYEKEPSS